ncbi:MAG: 50S ribosomal protein L11 methyltransferase [Acidobacteriota bacterium]
MFSIDLDCKQSDKEITIADLWEAGSTGIIEVEDGDDIARLRAFFDNDAHQAALLHRFGGEAQPADTRDWVAFAREHLKPMEIGQRIFVIPEWREEPTPPGRIRIVINAGLAFGTGAHETTRLCLEAIERHIKPGATLVDVGTGSGILAEVAIRLGAGRAVASDTDPDAVAVARENFARAGVAVPLFTGSADAIGRGVADVIVANISPAWIVELAPEWLRILKSGGVAILSGFEAADIPAVSAAIGKAGGRVAGEFGERDWRMLEVVRG